MMQEATTFNVFCYVISFQHLATVLISVFTLCYGPGLLLRGPILYVCILALVIRHAMRIFTAPWFVSIVAFWALQCFFCTLSHKWHSFGGKTEWHIACALIFPTNFVSSISLCKKNSARYYHICIYIYIYIYMSKYLHVSSPLCYKQLGRGWGTSKHNCLVSYLLCWRRRVSAAVDHLQGTKIYIEENYTEYDRIIGAYSKLSTRSHCPLDYTYWAKSTSSK